MRLLALILISTQALAQYGPGVGADFLNNTRIGGPWNSSAAFSFRAERTGLIQSVRLYVIYSTTSEGYSGGTGGTLKFALHQDRSGVPGAELTSVVHTDPMHKGDFPLLKFKRPTLVDSGRLYHVVITNTDKQPKVNYVSVNSLWMENRTNPRQPRYTDSSWYQLIRYGSGAWTRAEDTDSYTPILEVRYVDGFSFGMGYMEVWSENSKRITGCSAVRETFTPRSSHLVSGVTVRVRRVSGNAPLSVLLETADGMPLAVGGISGVGTEYGWYECRFSQTVLMQGESYNLTLHAPSGTVYQTHPVRDGQDYGFTCFPEGYAQFTTDGNWQGWDMWGRTNRQDADLQFMFRR